MMFIEYLLLGRKLNIYVNDVRLVCDATILAREFFSLSARGF